MKASSRLVRMATDPLVPFSFLLLEIVSLATVSLQQPLCNAIDLPYFYPCTHPLYVSSLIFTHLSDASLSRHKKF